MTSSILGKNMWPNNYTECKMNFQYDSVNAVSKIWLINPELYHNKHSFLLNQSENFKTGEHDRSTMTHRFYIHKMYTIVRMH